MCRIDNVFLYWNRRQFTGFVFVVVTGLFDCLPTIEVYNNYAWHQANDLATRNVSGDIP